MTTRYRVEDAVPMLKAKRKFKSALPLVLVGVASYVLWKQRDAIDGLLKSGAAKLGGATQTSPETGASSEAGTSPESVPEDYDWNRPSVANSTAMAGPVNGAGAPRGFDGGSMGTELGTQGEGAQ